MKIMEVSLWREMNEAISTYILASHQKRPEILLIANLLFAAFTILVLKNYSFNRTIPLCLLLQKQIILKSCLCCSTNNERIWAEWKHVFIQQFWLVFGFRFLFFLHKSKKKLKIRMHWLLQRRIPWNFFMNCAVHSKLKFSEANFSARKCKHQSIKCICIFIECEWKKAGEEEEEKKLLPQT